MADFTLSKSLFKGKHRDPSSLPGNIAYAVFVLFCFWAGAQILNLLAHAPGIYEQLMQLQMQETGARELKSAWASEPFLDWSLFSPEA
ncbi:Putative inner membrane protein [Citrobacter freundii]|uniref:Inner membrane protein n=1 Tax=Citrobacter freundii TaxID=546 RepID=A0A7G2IM48_CITFR|nr:Putative inner membrane protein [Citrobacter freundii]